jgi:H+-transporting ATPase
VLRTYSNYSSVTTKGSPTPCRQSTHDSLAPKAKVKRDAKWIEIEAFHLVPGDMISFKIGNIVPADCRHTESVNVSIDQAALTGESLPQNKKVGDECFS